MGVYPGTLPPMAIERTPGFKSYCAPHELMPIPNECVNRKRGLDVPGTKVPLSRLAKRIWQRLVEEDCANLAAQMSFYFLLSLFPFFVIVASLVGWLPSTTLWDRIVT